MEAGVQVLRVDWPVYPRRAEHNTVAKGGNRRWAETACRPVGLVELADDPEDRVLQRAIHRRLDYGVMTGNWEIQRRSRVDPPRLASHPSLQSLAVTKLELFFHDIPLGPATGFFYKYGQSIALVSNWQVLSGVNPLTRNLRNTDGLFPDRVKFTLKLFDPKTGTASFRGEEVLLVENQQSLWWQHQGYIDQVAFQK